MPEARVLVTRPQPQCAELARLLEARRVSAIEMPALGFAAAAQPFAPGPRWLEARQRLAVFTSPRAVEYGLAVLPPELLRNTLIAAIGPATAGALAQHGLSALQAPDGGYVSENLLQAPQLRHQPGAALILAAPGGRDALLEGLQALGWLVQVAEVYQRVPLPPEKSAIEALRASPLVVSTWTSSTAMSTVLGGLPEDVTARLLTGPWVVISERLAAGARDHGATDVQLADGPDNQALLRAALKAVQGGA